MFRFFTFLYFLLLLPGLASTQEPRQNIVPSGEIIKNPVSENNYINSVKNYIGSTDSLIADKQDSLNQIIKKTDTLTSLSSHVQDSIRAVLHSVDETINTIPSHELLPEIKPSFPGEEASGLPNLSRESNLSPLQSELGKQPLSLPGWVNTPQDVFQKVNVNVPDADLPTGSLPEVNNPEKQNIDQTIDNQAGKLDAVQELNQQSGDAFSQMDEAKDMSEDLKQYSDVEQMKQSGKSMANEEAMKKMNELFDQHSDKLEEVQNLMSKLKKKYSYVPNSNDLSTAKKANSLEGESLKKRLSVGGNFKFERGNPLTLDLSPYVLYKINKEFYAGYSASYRFRINYDPKAYTTHAEDVVGGSIIVRHKVYKGFFGYSEFEYRSAPVSYDSLVTSETIFKGEWVPGMLLGIGKEMTLKGKLKGTVILTYDFLYSDKSFNNSAWNVKFGFSLDDLDLKNRRKEMEESFLESIGSSVK